MFGDSARVLSIRIQLFGSFNHFEPCFRNYWRMGRAVEVAPQGELEPWRQQQLVALMCPPSRPACGSLSRLWATDRDRTVVILGKARNSSCLGLGTGMLPAVWENMCMCSVARTGPPLSRMCGSFMSVSTAYMSPVIYRCLVYMDTVWVRWDVFSRISNVVMSRYK